MEMEMKMEKTKCSAVCVTGGGGYLGSWLVRKLLKKGYVVHATLRNLGDESKVGLLKSFQDGDERLRLFEADIYDADNFKTAIKGCGCVFLVATPLLHDTSSSLYKNTTDASISAVQKILRACERSSSVKRVIYTGTVFSTSPLKGDGSGFKDSMDESCWTTLNYPFPDLRDYIQSKTATEKELLRYKYNSRENKVRDLEIVSLACGLVGGDTCLPYLPASMSVILSPLTREEMNYKFMKLLQILLGSVPLVHIDDVCEAHIFCMENTANISGRFICASAYPTMHEIVTRYEQEFPDAIVLEAVGDKIGIRGNSSKLIELGFKYKYTAEQILLGSIASAISLGTLPKMS